VPQLAMQAPQFAGSVCVSTQWPLHAVIVPGHEQTPAMHVVPAAHVVPQVPQFIGSIVGSTHTLPHDACPVGHITRQVPSVHASLSAQALSQVPQCS
jgi:hypothetical protein